VARPPLATPPGELAALGAAAAARTQVCLPLMAARTLAAVAAAVSIHQQAAVLPEGVAAQGLLLFVTVGWRNE
jgi:hypothetical protein